ncbi:serine O-acetyltransferase [Patulibacter sp. S7RM1-6]
MAVLGSLSRAVAAVRRDLRAAHERDPAARGVGAVSLVTTWPGVQALLAHRVSHGLHRRGVPFVPRLLAHVSRTLTGIEIHPAAEIGRGLFIDHGSGVVIGETARIGDDVTIYQGVTLGGTGFQVGKRHPTVGDRVTIGSGAKLLGPIEVGDDAKVGANSVVITDVPANTTVVGNPGHPVRIAGRRVEGPDADWIHLPDPIADAMATLGRRVVALEAQVRELGGHPEAEHVSAPADVEALREPKQGRSPAGG